MSEWTVVSWNVLADCYAYPSYYPHTPPEVLAPGARLEGVISRIASFGADVVCLQEAEAPVVDALRAALPGYDVHHALKSGRTEGCALIARHELHLSEVRRLAYADGAPDREDSGHIALLGQLSLGGQRVGIATTHVRFDPRGTPTEARWAVRQVRELLAAMGDGASIVCGDLNVTPTDEVYALVLASGFRDPCAEALVPTANSNEVAKRIDHLFHTAELVGTPLPIAAIDDATPLPSSSMPSDHLPVGARLGFGPR